MIRDRGSNFTRSFDAVFQATGARILRTAVQAPRMNATCELPRAARMGLATGITYQDASPELVRRYAAVEQGQDAGSRWMGRQEGDLVAEPAQPVPAASPSACGKDLDRPHPAVSGLSAPHLAVAALTERFLSGDDPLAVSLACTDSRHGR